MKRFLRLFIILLIPLILAVALSLTYELVKPMPAEETPPPTAAPPPSPSPSPTPEPTPEPAPQVLPPDDEYPAGRLALTLAPDDRAAWRILDDNYWTDHTLGAYGSLTLTAEAPISSMYIIFGTVPGTWQLETETGVYSFGEHGFLHEYVKLEEPADRVTLSFSGEGVMIRDIYAYTDGYPPSYVQTWNEITDGADILIFSTHNDDELLFMGGMIPYYSAVRALKVQVCYMTSNYQATFSNYRFRPHEALNGLWTAGTHYYPVTNPVPDIECETIWDAQRVYGEDQFLEFQVEMIRRFKPLVVVTQAEDGEYGHGAHILTALSAERAVYAAADPTQFPDSAQRYGVWDTPKTYLHKYGPWDEITILNYEQPAEALGGRTPFEVAQAAYRMHVTQQQWTGFFVYSYDHPQDSHRYGLFRSLVGPDIYKNDLMENVSREMFPFYSM